MTTRTHIKTMIHQGARKISSQASILGLTATLLLATLLIPAFGATPAGVTYRAHVQGIGWQSWVVNGATAGTTGQSLRLEAVQIKLFGMPSAMGIKYRAHVESIGWQPWVANGATAGTIGQSRRIEAVQIELTGASAVCSVTYRAHVEGIGWLPFVSNGMIAGTTGQSRRVEALEVYVQC
jgi:uncharacterized protein YjdB